MKSLLTSLVILLVLLPASRGRAHLDDFTRGNQACSRGAWEEGIAAYLRFAHRQGYSVSLLFNLANCYAAQGKVGLAIANYERALLLDPGDDDIRTNLVQVRRKAGLYDRKPPWYRWLAQSLGADQWALLAGAAFFLAAASLLMAQARGGRLSRLRWLAGLLVALSLATASCAWLQYGRLSCGVVTAVDGRLRISPFPQAEEVGRIRQGRLVCPRRRHGDYVLIRDSAGRQGWLPKKSISILADFP